MNIDLLFTQNGEAGLICNENPIKKTIGMTFDTQTGMLTAEYADMDFLELNIPVEMDFLEALDRNQQIHIGAVKEGNISQAYQVPFMFLDDPYRTQNMQAAKQVPNPLQTFENFVKSCVAGQPVHREDLGDEDAMGCVLGDAVPSSLEFAPHLARRVQMEAGPKAMPSLNLGPSAPGLGGGGGGSAQVPRGTNNTTPPKKRDDQ
ncbi:MAG: hypothetical protein AB8B83_06150 [Bdellovibrionales bacterium]